MSATSILHEARADGLILILSPSGALKVTGDPEKVNHWLPELREHKTAVIAALGGGADTGSSLPCSVLAMQPGEELMIRQWLARIEEKDPLIIEQVISRCQSDTEARRYFLVRAETCRGVQA